jgi:integrase
MARTIGRLTALTVSRLKERGMYPDGGGLYLQISKTGARSWVFRFKQDGRERYMGLGPFNAVSLAEARQKANDARSQRVNGVDPIQARSATRQATKAASTTFKTCAESYVASHSPSWTSERHTEQWQKTLEAYVYPQIGEMSVEQVDTAAVRTVLDPIWFDIPETASRVRNRIELILDAARANGLRNGDNPARWRGHLDKLLPARSKLQVVKHHPAMSYDKLPAFMARLRERNGASRRALELTILTAVRTDATIAAHSREIDVESAVWAIPADRMKGRRQHRSEHRVPLVGRALEIAKATADGYLFAGQGGREHLHHKSMIELLDTMGIHDATVHGFRSTFKDWAAECTEFDDWVSEKALAHAVGDETRRAYQRGELLAKRRLLMTAWDVFCRRSTGRMTVWSALRQAISSSYRM